MPTPIQETPPITYNNGYPVFFTGEAKLSAPSPDHFIAWDYTFMPQTEEPWTNRADWVLTMGSESPNSEGTYYLDHGIWSARVTSGNLSETNAVELLLNGNPIAQLTGPGDYVEFATPWRSDSGNQLLSARFTNQWLSDVNIEIRWREEYTYSGIAPEVTTQGPFITLVYQSDWESPKGGVFTATPRLFNAEKEIVATGDTLTLIIESGSNGSC